MVRKVRKETETCPDGKHCPAFDLQIPVFIERMNTDIKWLKKETKEIKEKLGKLEGRLWHIVVTVALGIIASSIFALVISKLL